MGGSGGHFERLTFPFILARWNETHAKWVDVGRADTLAIRMFRVTLSPHEELTYLGRDRWLKLTA